MKYRMGRQFFLSMGVRPSRNVSNHALDTNRKKWANVFANIISAQVRLFYELDDISRIMTGTRDTITRGGSKQQWRVLLDTMLNLNAKFREELTVLRYHTVSFACYDHSLYSTRQTGTETHGCASCMRI